MQNVHLTHMFALLTVVSDVWDPNVRVVFNLSPSSFSLLPPPHLPLLQHGLAIALRPPW
jgi:hypothetical protein